ncbi:MAG: segregation/condensation protein A [Candidatus Omnitrophica bacterium]|nr:segregation/condensation protein A [Candidatus Omnitrophota bacterium]
MSYKVRLHIFEGPLDLLLHLIKSQEIDIYNIPIAQITRQYLDYLEVMQLLDLNIAGDFLVMAATLMAIKSKLLLPKEALPPEEQELDPREELVRRLLEYQRFKALAEQLAHLETKSRQLFTRPTNLAVGDEVPLPPQEGPYFEASLFDLLSAFSQAMKEVPKEVFYEVMRDETTVEQKIKELRAFIQANTALVFQELLAGCRTQMAMIATFLAILELVRSQEVVARQDTLFGPIQIVRREQPVMRFTYGTGTSQAGH